MVVRTWSFLFGFRASTQTLAQGWHGVRWSELATVWGLGFRGSGPGDSSDA